MADDFVLNIILLKKRDCLNLSMPFLHAHALELSSKAALSHLGSEVDPKHHIREMLDTLAETVEGLRELLPSDDAFSRYHELWLSDDGAGKYELSSIPAPQVCEEWELCYFIENVVDLKYGTRKDQSLVSMLDIATPKLNRRFKKVFRLLRSQYSSQESSSRIVNRGLGIFGATDANRAVLEDIFWPIPARQGVGADSDHAE